MRDRLARVARLGGISARTSAGWLASALLEGAGRSEPAARLRRVAAERAAESLGRLKGLAMKAGQMLSFVSEEVPEELRQALSRLQTSSEPRPFHEIAATIERSLGAPAARLFRSIDPSPLASASIGQVHRAVPPDGTEVVVKVQYADASRAVRSDLANVGLPFQSLRLLLPGVDPASLVAELRQRIAEELDYRAEAEKQGGFAARFAGHPFIAIPRVIEPCSGAEVLTSEYVEGRRFSEVLGDPGPLRFPTLWTDGALGASAGKTLAALRRGVRMPRDLLFLNRAMAGLYMVLARLGAVANWHRIAREYTLGEPPSSPLGEAERAWAARRPAGPSP